MTRLYTLAATAADVADHFGAGGFTDIAVPSETIEALPGLVVHEANGRRHLRQMLWGFRRHTREMRLRGDPPGRIGLVADLTNPMWEGLVVEPKYRCLIPLTHFANPNGAPGEKTRSWFSAEGQPIMAWAGFAKNTPELGPVYAGMTMDANELVHPYNDRMPVLLLPHEYERWLHGSIKDVIGFQFRPPPPPENFIVEHTDDLWRSGKLPPSASPQGALL
ncbi:SOS response-associated peptidase family protein [Sphingopyxis sp.]|uniref:SOS response-associated peptidase family protein n=1 Tax=Sphingopyxis sp. TaxID=1908224 RepID=UPI0035AE009C